MLLLCQPHPLSVSTLNCSHLACINSSTPLQIHLVSLRLSPDRTSTYPGRHPYLALVYLLTSLFTYLLTYFTPLVEIPCLIFFSFWIFTTRLPAAPAPACLHHYPTCHPALLLLQTINLFTCSPTPVLPLCSAFYVGSSSYCSNPNSIIPYLYA